MSRALALLLLPPLAASLLSTRPRLGLVMAARANPLLEDISKSVSEATGAPFAAQFGRGGAGGGGGASVGTLVDAGGSGEEYFYKMGGLDDHDMLMAEFVGVREMAATGTIKVPRPICFGSAGYNAYAVFEKLDLGGRGDTAAFRELGRQLARMHRCTSPDGRYGFHLDNTIGATPQPNPWTDDWCSFWMEHRLKHMLHLMARQGYSMDKKTEQQFIARAEEVLRGHEAQASLVHGDLWGGNRAFTPDGPAIYDPATYYGDREVDIAMTYMFGGFNGAFYDGYNEEWPLPEGHQLRRYLYNWYHYANHVVLFGGSYWNGVTSHAQSVIRG